MNKNLILRELNELDEAAFLKWYDSWLGDDLHWATFIWEHGMTHSEHLQKLEDSKDQTKIPVQFVPSTMLYAFVDHEIVGRLSVRHRLNENLEMRGGHIGYSVGKNHRRKGYAKEMFRQALYCCKNLNLSRILVTCDDQNEPSWRVIESFSGSLENRLHDPEENKLIRRYWVDVEEALRHITRPKVL